MGSERPTRSPDYGLDAPGVVRNFLILGALGIASIVLRLLGVWDTRHTSAAIFMPLSFGGTACLLTGLWMIYSSRVGKVRSREHYLDRLPWRGDETVLDVGCGRGLFLVAAAKRVPRGKAVGVDLWQAEDLAGNSPDATRENARLEGVADRIDIQTGDARKLPFPDATFDTVVSSVALHNIYDDPGRRQAIAEIARVLRPGGHVLIVDIRHTAQYADELRRGGMTDVAVRRTVTSYLSTLVTMGSLRTGVVTGRKSA